MTQAPCYDTVNHKDCPKRQWCKEVGRSHCEDWVKYETIHKQEKEQEAKDREARNASYDHSNKIKARYLRSLRNH